MKTACWGECKESHPTFVYTEVFGCGEVGKVFIESYVNSGVDLDQFPIHVFGYRADLQSIPEMYGVKKIQLKIFRKQAYRYINSHSIRYAYKRGHAGTALTWLLILLTSNSEKIIHIDSDTILLKDLVSSIDSRLNDGYDLVGPRRPYKNNAQGIVFDEGAPDLVQTCIFGFRPSLITLDRKFLENYRMILGTFNPTGVRTLDFFDPVSLEILSNSGRTFFLDFNQVGGLNSEGNRDNKYAKLNNFQTLRKIDVGESFIHFSAVGTGVNVYNNPNNRVPLEYAEYALDRFALYSKIFFGNDLGRDLTEYDVLIEGLERILGQKLSSDDF